MAKETEELKTLGITVKKSDDMPEWYGQVCQKAELAEPSVIKGCMIIRPNGMQIWENIQAFFDARIKTYGVKNAYFPTLIPESFFKREEAHAEGFKAEVAWIEKKDEGGERLALRPTSETIMYDSYSRWIRSWRDLPLRINQWCNVFRWEVSDTKVFLRTREFLWQEGHCVYETEEECEKETKEYLQEYVRVAEELLAFPVLTGKKSEHEKFAGAKTTYTIEALMPDGKALQMGTSHNLGQHFAKAFGIEYVGSDKEKHLPWQNSWGISTRMIGAVVMVHGDDKGFVLPPRVAQNKVVIVPILFDDTKDKVVAKCKELMHELAEFNPILDDRIEYNPGFKFNHWELRGIPFRLELGPKDLEKDSVVFVRRDTGKKEFIKTSEIKKKIHHSIDEMHGDMFSKAKKAMETNIVSVKEFKEFEEAVKDRKLIKAAHCGNFDCEEQIKQKTTATCRCIIEKEVSKEDACFNCGEKAKYFAYFAKNY
jgi:prolyl-tRNA synthetase